jgi:hypothetical protein
MNAPDRFTSAFKVLIQINFEPVASRPPLLLRPLFAKRPPGLTD